MLDTAQFAEAEKASRAWIASLDRQGTDQSEEYASALDLLAETLGSTLAPLNQIQPLADRSIAIRTNLGGSADVSIAAVLNTTGIRKFRASAFAGAIEDFSRAMNLEEGAPPPPPSALLAETLNGYGLTLGGKGEPARALEFHQRALVLREKEFGPDNWRTAEVLFSISTDYRQMGDLNRSMEFSKRSIAIFERSNPGHPSAAQAIGTLASAYRERGEYSLARPLFEKSIQVYERSLGPDNPRLVASYNNYGLCLRSLSDFNAAGIAMERAVAISRKANGPNSPITAQALGNLGILYQQEGDYPRAREAYQTALNVLEETLGPAHEGTASVLTSLGLILRDMGDLRAARRYIERALAIYEKSFGPDNPKTLQLVSNLGSILHYEKDYRAARILKERVLAAYRKTLGPDNTTTAAEMASLAADLAELGEVQTAKDLYRQTIAVFVSRVGPDSYGGAQSQSELAELELSTGNSSAALDLIRQSAASFRKLFGPDYPILGGVLAVQADVELRLGERAAAFDDALESARIRRRSVLEVARTTAERQALIYAEKGGNGLDVALRVAAGGVSPEARYRLWDAVVRDRALVLDEMAERQRSTRALTDPELAGRSRGLTAAREDLAKAVVAGPRPKERDYSGRIDLLRASVESQERQLATQSVEFRSRLEREHAGLSDVITALPQASALVAYARYSGGYLAFVIRAGEQSPAVIAIGSPSGTGQHIDSLIHNWRVQIDRERTFQGREAAKNEASCREAGRALRRAIWDPLSTHLVGVNSVYLTADGLLQLVNFPALPVGTASYLVEIGPVLHLLSAERDIQGNPSLTSAGEMLAVGGPAFDGKPSSAFSTKDLFRGVRTNCAAFSSLDFPLLPGSAHEAQSVLQVWRARGHTGILLTGDRATESGFKELSSGKRVIHIATHGFFLGNDCASRLTPEDPLLRSGLAFAGANRRAQAGTGQDDGILTAEEVASLDLSSAELVVLSGCDTGAGEIRAGEGILGLRRAFRIAGAQNLIMSLWQVTDEGAREWMAALYNARFSRQKSTAEAVRDASLSQLRARRAAGISTHPFYWAGFIAVGGA